MRSVNFSQDSVAIQYQYLKRNLHELGMSGVLRNLEVGLNDFRTRRIEDKYKYLLVDGLWVKVRAGDGLHKMVILLVLGITMDNKKEIVAFRHAKGETEEEVTALLNDLYRRGLEGKRLKPEKAVRTSLSTCLL